MTLPPIIVCVYIDEQLALAGYFEDKPHTWRYFWVSKTQADFCTTFNYPRFAELETPCAHVLH